MKLVVSPRVAASAVDWLQPWLLWLPGGAQTLVALAIAEPAYGQSWGVCRTIRSAGGEHCPVLSTIAFVRYMQLNELPRATTRFPPTHHPLLSDLTRVLHALRANTRNSSDFPTVRDPVAFYNRYIEFAIAVYLSKFRQLYEALAASVEAEHYLVYAATGRAIIENTATLRYYSFHPDLLALRAAWGTSHMNDEVLRSATSALDKFVRGNRFTWEAFIAGRYDELASRSDGDTPSQVNVATCLDKWYKDHPALRGLYALLCDLVHPNLGSNFLVLRRTSGGLHAGGEQGRSVCDFIVLPTLAGVVGSYTEIQAAGTRLEGLGLRQ